MTISDLNQKILPCLRTNHLPNSMEIRHNTLGTTGNRGAKRGKGYHLLRQVLMYSPVKSRGRQNDRSVRNMLKCLCYEDMALQKFSPGIRIEH